MTASQNKRIRAKLVKAAALTAEASALCRDALPLGGELRTITAHAADALALSLRQVEAMDFRDQQTADQIARELREEAGMTEDEKQVYRRAKNHAIFDAKLPYERAVGMGHAAVNQARADTQEA